MCSPESDGNQPDTTRILAEVVRIGRVVDGLAAEWERLRPVAEGFTRGGVLAARAAARTARKAGRQGEQL